MKYLVIAIVQSASPVWAQTKPSPKAAAVRDNCAPIGRTEDGKLVYSMKCETLPVPPAPPPEPKFSAAGFSAGPMKEIGPAIRGRGARPAFAGERKRPWS